MSEGRLANKHILGVGVLLGLVLIQGLFLMSRDSPTYDEPNHITCGYSYLKTGDFRMSLAQPPVARMIMATPLLFMRLNLPLQNESWKQADDWAFAREFLFFSGNNADAIVFWSRLPILLLSLLCGIFVFAWSRELFGIRAAYFSLVLYVFSPNLLAHGRLATTDMPLTCLALITSYYFWKFLENPGVKRAAISGVLLGLTLSVKYTGIIFILSFLIVAIVWGRRQSAQASHVSRPLASRASRTIVGHTIVALCIGVAIALFSSGPSMKPVLSYPAVQTKVTRLGEKQVFMFKNERAGRLAYKVASSVPVPRYVVGMLFNQFHFARGHFAYLAGQWKLGGWWYYFPVAFILKVPLPLVVLLCAWLLMRLRKPSYFSSAQLVLLCVPVVSLIWSMAFVRLNIGFRHILFVLPFFHVLLGSLVSRPSKVLSDESETPGGHASSSAFAGEDESETPNELVAGAAAAGGVAPSSSLQVTNSRRALANGAIGPHTMKTFFLLPLVIWYCIESLVIFPHHLAYFNELAGGPKGGVNWLVDSNLDWGQDLKRLRSYVDNRKIESLKLFYFGTADPTYYGINYKPLTLQDFKDLDVPEGTYLAQEYVNEKWALSVTNYAALLRTAPWLKKIQGREDARIGYSIFVFSPPRLKSVLFPGMVLEARNSVTYK